MILAPEQATNWGREVDSLRCPNVDTSLAGEIGLVRAAETAFTSEGLDLNTKLSGSSGERPERLLGLSEVNTDKLSFAFRAIGDGNHCPRGANVASALFTEQHSLVVRHYSVLRESRRRNAIKNVEMKFLPMPADEPHVADQDRNGLRLPG